MATSISAGSGGITVTTTGGGSASALRYRNEAQAAAALAGPLLDYTAEMTALGLITADITAVADIDASVVTVAAIAADVTAVAAIAADVTRVADEFDANEASALAAIAAAEDATLDVITAAGEAVTGTGGTIDSREDVALAAITASAVAREAELAIVPGADMYAAAADAISDGVVSVTITAAGSGGTPATYYWTTTGGTGTDAAGYAITAGSGWSSVVCTHPGQGYTTGESISIAGSHGVTGATLDLVTAPNATVGELFLVAEEGAIDVYSVDSGGATTTRVEGMVTTSVLLMRYGDKYMSVESIGDFVVSGISRDGVTTAADNAVVASIEDRLVTLRYGDKYQDVISQGDWVISAVYRDGTTYGAGLELAPVEADVAALDVRVTEIEMPSPGASTLRLGPKGELKLITVNGQSTANGSDSFNAFSTVAVSGVKMWNGGRYDSQVSGNYVSLTDLVESDVGGVFGESPLRGIAEGYVQGLDDNRSGATLASLGVTLLISSAAKGGVPVADLLPGSTWHSNLLYGVGKAVDYAAANSLIIAGQSMHMLLGESDTAAVTAPATFKTSNQTIRDSLQAKWVELVGPEAPRVTCYMTQVSSSESWGVDDPAIARAQLELAEEDPDFVLVTPVYFMDFCPTAESPTGGNMHFAALTSKHVGFYLGDAEETIERGEAWEVTKAVRWWRQGAMAVIEYDVPNGPLVLDTTIVSDPGNYGFNLFNAAGTEKTITSVALLGTNRVKITAALDIDDGDYWMYASRGWSGTSTTPNGRTTGTRGCLRDSTAKIYDPSDLALKGYRWAVIQKGVF